MKEIILEIVEKNVSLVFMDGESEIAREEWVDENNLQETFFAKFDGLLESNSLYRDRGVKYTFIGDLSQGYTTNRIGKTIMGTLDFASKNG